MKIFNMIVIFIYTLLFSVIGALLIALSLRTESLEAIIKIVTSLSHLNNVRFGMALVGLSLILVNISIAHLFLGKLKKRKTIAFENPYGQVTVTLAAIEDYIKKLTRKIIEIKEIKANVTAGKSGIEVVAKAVLYSGSNIPEVTEKIQNAIRLRLQEMLGIEETITVKIHVTKIVDKEKESEQQSGFKGEIEYGR